MKFQLVAVLGCSLSALAQTTNYTTVVSDLQAVESLTTTLHEALHALRISKKNGLNEAVGVDTDTNNVESQLQQTIYDVGNSTNFGKKGSAQVAQAVLSLTPVVISTLNNTVHKKAFFANCDGQCSFDLTGIVLSSLQQQQQLSDQLGAALLPKLAKAERKAAPEIQSQLDNAFSSAISVYSATATTTCTPRPT